MTLIAERWGLEDDYGVGTDIGMPGGEGGGASKQLTAIFAHRAV